MNTPLKSRPLLRQEGMALVASLIILLLMTVVGLSLIRGNSAFEKAAGNVRDKQRALLAAQDALLYGEYWLSNNSPSQQPSCSTTPAANAMQVCPGDLTANITTVTTNLAYFTPYTQITGLQTQTAKAGTTAGGLVTSGSSTSDIIYSKPPSVYITCVSGSCSAISTGQILYRVTAVGYAGVGGLNATTAVVQSVFAAGSGNPVPNPLY